MKKTIGPPNWKLIDHTLEAIRESPERFNMRSFVSACGTTMCFAGWALTLTGHTLEADFPSGHTYLDGDAYAEIADLAAQELNIDDVSADRIFYATLLGDDVDKLEALILDTFGGRPENY